MPAYDQWGMFGSLIFLVVAFGGFLLKLNHDNNTAMDKRDKSVQEYQDKRDAEWRNFFTLLNSSNKEDICALADTMERIAKNLDAHDLQAKLIKEAVDRIAQNTRPRKQANGAGAD